MAKEIQVETLKNDSNIIPVSTGNYQDSFLYGKSIEAIDYNTGVKNKPTAGGLMKIGHFTISATGSKVITGVGFTPTNLQIISNVSGGSGPIKSIGLTDGTNMYNVYDYNTTTGMKSYYVTTSVIYLEDGSSGTFYDTKATITSFDSDGFTLDVTNNTLGGTKEYTYIAYG